MIGATTSLATNHSHVCGINHTVTFNVNFKYESFPRMWDQRNAIKSIFSAVRIIPTYVGSTSTSFTHCVIMSNHSHVCGINTFLNAFMPQDSESFPRMWDQLIVFNWVSVAVPNHSHVCGINDSIFP